MTFFPKAPVQPEGALLFLRNFVQSDVICWYIFRGFNMYSNSPFPDYYTGTIEGYIMEADMRTLLEQFCRFREDVHRGRGPVHTRPTSQPRLNGCFES